MAYTLDFGLTLGTGKAGLSDLRAQLVDTAGVAVGAAVSSGFTEIGSGCYLWNCASIPDGHRGGVVVYSAATPADILAFGAINPEEAERVDAAVSSRATQTSVDDLPTNAELSTALAGADDAVLAAITALEATLTAIKGAGWSTETLKAIDTLLDAIKAKTDTIGAAIVTVVSPVAADGDITLYQGDDYANADGRAFEWTNTAGTWPDLTSATLTFAVRGPDGTLLTASGSVIVPTGAGQKIRVELTAAQTAELEEWANASELRIRATLASGRKATLVDATLAAIADIIE